MADETQTSSQAPKKPPQKAEDESSTDTAQSSEAPPPQKTLKLTIERATMTEAPENDFVEVMCPGMKEPYRIHKHMLCQASNNFKRRIDEAHVSRNGLPRVRLELEEEMFEIMRRWLYEEPMYQQDVTRGVIDELQILMLAHNAGAVFNTSGFQDAVMDLIIELLVEHGGKISIARLVPPKARYFPPSGSRPRKLLADWIACGELDHQRSTVTQLPRDADFREQLLATFITRKLNGTTGVPYLTNPCRYHLHRGTEKCSEEKIKTESGD